MTDLDQLRAKYPGWEISSHYVEAASGPGFGYIHAECGDEMLNAATPEELERLIRNTEDVECLAADLLREAPQHVFTVRRVLRHFREGTMSPSVAVRQLRSVRS